MNWLVGSTMDGTAKYKQKSSSKSKILEIQLGDDSMESIGGGKCLLERSDGTTFTKSYDATVNDLFSMHKQVCLERGDLVRWPDECDTDITSITESATCLVLRKPKIGDVARMLFNQRDLFVDESKVWSIGTVLSVSEVDDSSFKIKVVWSDKIEEEYNYPNDDLEILTPKENSFSKK